MVVWVINPYDELPNATDIPLRYWSLCKELVSQGHEVIWWSSDFSHRTKSHRSPCPPLDGFHIELVPTPAYQKNISWARLRNHQTFAQRFLQLAREKVLDKQLRPPDRLVVSLPPLETAQAAFSLREEFGGEVVLDIMDAWPEIFFQVLPQSLSRWLGPLLFRHWVKLARNAHRRADRISAVGYQYLKNAAQYCGDTVPLWRKGVLTSSHVTNRYHLCYHGVDLRQYDSATKRKESSSEKIAVYIGALEKGYDLQTVLEVAHRWEQNKAMPWTLHIAGQGSKEGEWKRLCQTLWGKNPPTRLVWHGYLQSQELRDLLRTATVGIIPNRASSHVSCPYKMGEYTGAGLPILSCLPGESAQLLAEWKAGLSYEEGNPDSLSARFEELEQSPGLVEELASNSSRMAHEIFDRTKTYPEWVRFILS